MANDASETNLRTILFRYDRSHDVVIATPRWTLETDADVVAWYKQYEDYLSTFGRKMDIVFVLSDFHVKAAVTEAFAEARARMVSTLTNRSYRVQPDAKTRLLVATGRVRYGTQVNEVESEDAAIAALLADRAAK